MTPDQFKAALAELEGHMGQHQRGIAADGQRARCASSNGSVTTPPRPTFHPGSSATRSSRLPSRTGTATSPRTNTVSSSPTYRRQAPRAAPRPISGTLLNGLPKDLHGACEAPLAPRNLRRRQSAREPTTSPPPCVRGRNSRLPRGAVNPHVRFDERRLENGATGLVANILGWRDRNLPAASALPAGRDLQRVHGILDGDLTAPADDWIFVVDCSPDRGDDPYDRATWAKAHPMLGVTITESALADLADEARTVGGDFDRDFRRKTLNLPGASLPGAWLSLSGWQDGQGGARLPVRSRVAMGIDLAFSMDLTASGRTAAPVGAMRRSSGGRANAKPGRPRCRGRSRIGSTATVCTVCRSAARAPSAWCSAGAAATAGAKIGLGSSACRRR